MGVHPVPPGPPALSDQLAERLGIASRKVLVNLNARR